MELVPSLPKPPGDPDLDMDINQFMVPPVPGPREQVSLAAWRSLAFGGPGIETPILSPD